MRTLRYLIQKEFLQILRNRAILPLMTIVPIIQLLILSNAASNELKEIHTVVVDKDQSESSRLLTRKIMANDRFTLVATTHHNAVATDHLQTNEADIVLEIPQDFEKNFRRGERPKLQLLVNAINGQKATVGLDYISNIIGSFNAEIRPQPSFGQDVGPPIKISNRNWYNPELNYPHFMAPGILAELAALLTIVLSAMNVVRERELGTIEQINVTPIKKWQFIVGKLVPFLCVGMFLLTVGLIVSKLAFDIPIAGNLALVFGYAVFNLIAVLGLGLFISNFAETQQQAIFVAWFFIMIFLLMCGLFTPIESMPQWAQYLTIPNPLAHIISVSRKVLMKGSGLWDIRWEFLYTIILAIVLNTLAIWSYRKRL